MTNAPTLRKSPHECINPETRHDYDEISGWCLKGCGNRDDGRVTSRFGDVIAPGDESKRNTQEGMPLWA